MKSREARVIEALEGASHEEIGDIVERLAAIIAATTPDPLAAGRLFGEAVGNSAMAMRSTTEGKSGLSRQPGIECAGTFEGRDDDV